jgi:hypothetical protein
VRITPHALHRGPRTIHPNPNLPPGARPERLPHARSGGHRPKTPRQPQPRARAALWRPHPRRLPLPCSGHPGKTPLPHAHGHYSAEARARDRHILTLARRARVTIDAVRHADRLPPEFAARLNSMAPELLPPPWPSGGLSRAEDRAVQQSEAEALAPWKLAVAAAREAGRRAIMAPPEPPAPEAWPTAGIVASVSAATPHAPEAQTHHPAPQPDGASLVTPPRTGSSSPAAEPGSACPAARTPRAVRSPDTAGSPPAAAPPACRTPRTSAAEPSPG